MIHKINDHGEWFSYEYAISEEEATRRLDVVATERLKALGKDIKNAPEWFITHQPTRVFIQSLIESQQLLVNGEVASKASAKYAEGAIVCMNVVAECSREITPDDNVPFEVVFEDHDLMVVNKPAGVVVHPGAGVREGTLVNGIAAYLNSTSGPGESDRPGIVHRLDKDTSGLLVVAKTQRAFAGLVEQFKDRRIKRVYNAVVLTRPMGEGTIDLPIGRNPKRRVEMAVVEAGKPAVTRWEVADTLRNALLLELALETGRTHQIRVHLKAAKAPIVGDQVYGGSYSNLSDKEKREIAALGRQALHARRLQFEHPITGEMVKFECDLPLDIQKIIQVLN